MNLMSTKNQLQEYCQKHNLYLPKYEHRFYNQELVWQSKVTINVNGDLLEKWSSKNTKKVNADQDAAKQMYEYISTLPVEIETEPVPSPSPSRETVYGMDFPLPELSKGKSYLHIIIDFENIAKEPDHDHDLDLDLNVYKFVAHNCAKAQTQEPDFIFECSIKDAIDHYISYYVGKLIAHHKQLDIKYRIIILTKDHFASILAHIDTNVYHVTNLKRCNDLILECTN